MLSRLLPLLLLAPLAAAAATPVTVQPLGELLITVEDSAPATLLARNQPQLAAEINALITENPEAQNAKTIATTPTSAT